MSLRDESSWDLGEILSERVFWVERGKKEAKILIWKTVIICPLKTENPLISRVSYSRSYSQNGLSCIEHVSQEVSSHERVTRSYFSWKSRKGVAKLCVNFWKKLKLAPSFSLVDSYLRLTRKNSSEWVFQQKQNGIFGKTLNTKKFIKILSKTYKILKNLFEFDH